MLLVNGGWKPWALGQLEKHHPPKPQRLPIPELSQLVLPFGGSCCCCSSTVHRAEGMLSETTKHILWSRDKIPPACILEEVGTFLQSKRLPSLQNLWGEKCVQKGGGRYHPGQYHWVMIFLCILLLSLMNWTDAKMQTSAGPLASPHQIVNVNAVCPSL